MKHVLLAIGLILSLCAQAQPKETITLLYAFSPADTTGNYSRVLAMELNKAQNKYNFIMDGKPGAGGTLAVNEVSMAKAGTHILHHSTAFFVRPNIFPKESWNVADYKEQWLYCAAPMVISSVKYKTWAEVAAAKDVSIGISGLGVTTHLMAVQLKKKYPNLNIIPFKSTTDAMMSILSGNTDLAIGFAGEVTKWEGKMTALGITGQRSYPNFPTLVSQGHDAVFGGMVVGQHLAVPQSFPESKRKEIYELILKVATNNPALTERFAEDLCQPRVLGYDRLDGWFNDQTAYWKNLSQGIKVD
jgi:tripartite-type tricarboxylate transporter receptor subunit TctC